MSPSPQPQENSNASKGPPPQPAADTAKSSLDTTFSVKDSKPAVDPTQTGPMKILEASQALEAKALERASNVVVDSMTAQSGSERRRSFMQGTICALWTTVAVMNLAAASPIIGAVWAIGAVCWGYTALSHYRNHRRLEDRIEAMKEDKKEKK